MSWPSVLFLRYTVKHLPPWLLHHSPALPHVDLAKTQKVNYSPLAKGAHLTSESMIPWLCDSAARLSWGSQMQSPSVTDHAFL